MLTYASLLFSYTERTCLNRPSITINYYYCAALVRRRRRSLQSSALVTTATFFSLFIQFRTPPSASSRSSSTASAVPPPAGHATSKSVSPSPASAAQFQAAQLENAAVELTAVIPHVSLCRHVSPKVPKTKLQQRIPTLPLLLKLHPTRTYRHRFSWLLVLTVTCMVVSCCCSCYWFLDEMCRRSSCRFFLSLFFRVGLANCYKSCSISVSAELCPLQPM